MKWKERLVEFVLIQLYNSSLSDESICSIDDFFMVEGQRLFENCPNAEICRLIAQPQLVENLQQDERDVLFESFFSIREINDAKIVGCLRLRKNACWMRSEHQNKFMEILMNPSPISHEQDSI